MSLRRQRERTAVEWLVELETSDDVRALLPAFEAWLQEAPQNRSAYRELQEISRAAGRALRTRGQLGSAGFELPPNNSSATARKRRMRPWWTAFAGLAATVLTAACLLWGVVTLKLARNPAWRSYQSGYEALPPIPLQDGSWVRLNTWTQLSVRETPQARSVRLQQGEALFTVLADRSRPFTVSVGGVVVHAIGTEFSVRRQSEDVVDAFVSSGSIEVLTRGAGALHADGSGDHVVAAGQAVHIVPSGVEITAIGLLGVRRRLAWAAGMIECECTLAEAVAEFNRHNRRRIVIVDPAIAARHIQGLFKATAPETFAKELQQVGIPYSVAGATSADDGVIRLGVTR